MEDTTTYRHKKSVSHVQECVENPLNVPKDAQLYSYIWTSSVLIYPNKSIFQMPIDTLIWSDYWHNQDLYLI